MIPRILLKFSETSIKVAASERFMIKEPFMVLLSIFLL